MKNEEQIRRAILHQLHWLLKTQEARKLNYVFFVFRSTVIRISIHNYDDLLRSSFEVLPVAASVALKIENVGAVLLGCHVQHTLRHSGGDSRTNAVARRV